MNPDFLNTLRPPMKNLYDFVIPQSRPCVSISFFLRQAIANDKVLFLTFLFLVSQDPGSGLGQKGLGFGISGAQKPGPWKTCRARGHRASVAVVSAPCVARSQRRTTSAKRQKSTKILERGISDGLVRGRGLKEWDYMVLMHITA